MFDPAILSYAFIESYLQSRNEDKWKIPGFQEITAQNLKEKVKDDETRRKIKQCIDTIYKINEKSDPASKISLILDLAEVEKQETNFAITKSNEWLYLKRPFVNRDPHVSQLHRALRSLYLNDIKDTDEYKKCVNKLKSQIEMIKDPTEAEKKAADTRDNALAREKQKASLKEELKFLESDFDFYKEFYTNHVKTDKKGMELKEDSIEKCKENVESKARNLSFCRRICPNLLNPIKKTEDIKPIIVTPPIVKPEPHKAIEIPVKVIPEVRRDTPTPVIKIEPAKHIGMGGKKTIDIRPVTVNKNYIDPEIVFTNKPTPVVRTYSSFFTDPVVAAQRQMQKPAAVLPQRELRPRKPKKETDYYYPTPLRPY